MSERIESERTTYAIRRTWIGRPPCEHPVSYLYRRDTSTWRAEKRRWEFRWTFPSTNCYKYDPAAIEFDSENDARRRLRVKIVRQAEQSTDYRIEIVRITRRVTISEVAIYPQNVIVMLAGLADGEVA